MTSSKALTLVLLCLVPWNTDSANVRRKRELFRDKVDPKDGGKVPESNINRLEFNKLDAMGLRDTRGQSMSERLKDTILSDKAGASTPFGVLSNPGFFSPYPYEEDNDHRSVYDAPYEPPKPKQPVLLKERPNEVKEIKPVPITIHDTYTNFDCRKVPYSDKHYADSQTGCATYHFCHANGKQDSFTCPYGTSFNEYLGTCDHSSAVSCVSAGKGYEPQPPQSPYKSPPINNAYAPTTNYYPENSYFSPDFNSPTYAAYDTSGYSNY